MKRKFPASVPKSLLKRQKVRHHHGYTNPNLTRFQMQPGVPMQPMSIPIQMPPMKYMNVGQMVINQ